jgi:hypothetical protein
MSDRFTRALDRLRHAHVTFGFREATIFALLMSAIACAIVCNHVR